MQGLNLSFLSLCYAINIFLHKISLHVFLWVNPLLEETFVYVTRRQLLLSKSPLEAQIS